VAYFEVLGEHSPVAAAIEHIPEGENLGAAIEIVSQDGANIRKGFDLLIRAHGICAAITWFGGNRNLIGRQDCLILLVEACTAKCKRRCRKPWRRMSPMCPEDARTADLIAGRPWLLTTPIARPWRRSSDSRAILSTGARCARQRNPPPTHKALDPIFRLRGDPPFEDPCVDNAAYPHTLLGERVEEAIAHFREKIVAPNVRQGHPAPAEVLVGLLTRLENYAEAYRHRSIICRRHPASRSPALRSSSYAKCRAIIRNCERSRTSATISSASSRACWPVRLPELLTEHRAAHFLRQRIGLCFITLLAVRLFERRPRGKE
jgi:hypothetical protein